MADIKEDDHKRLLAEATAKATTDAQAAATARIGGIMSCDEAAGRATLAQHLAFKTAMSVDEAKVLLSVSAKEVTATAPAAGAAATTEQTAVAGTKTKEQIAADFAATMDKSKHPNLHQDGGGDEEQNASGDQATTILKNYAAHGGYVRKSHDEEKSRRQ